MNNPIKSLSRREWALWLASLAVVLIANLMTPELDPLTVTAALVGVTSLVFAAKGNVWAQILMILFSILYGVISFRFLPRHDAADGRLVHGHVAQKSVEGKRQ